MPFRDRTEADRTWLHVVVMIEVQGTVDHLMALRIRNYVDNHHLELWRGRRFRAADRLAPVLPIVIYTGAWRWTAAARVIDLVTPAADDTQPDPASRRSGLFAGDGYLMLDTLRFDLGVDDMAEVDRLHESGELEAYFARRRRAYRERYRKEGLAQGLEQGLEQGNARGIAAERTLLQRQAVAQVRRRRRRAAGAAA